ncbi:MAG: hypothetical protein JNL18_18655 [Planctomycetaceae bacterium]|nr:hypothetical protein [Planctomycetaceae bacterium]
MDPSLLNSLLSRADQVLSHPCQTDLCEIVCAARGAIANGHPTIPSAAFTAFVERVPHLFGAGERLLVWLRQAEDELRWLPGVTYDEIPHAGFEVLRRLTYTAAICAPAELWVAAHLLSNHATAGVLDEFARGGGVRPMEIAVRRGLDPLLVDAGIRFLHARGYLDLSSRGYVVSSGAAARSVVLSPHLVMPPQIDDPVECLVARWGGDPSAGGKALDQLLAWLASACLAPASCGWVAGLREIRLGYLVLLLTLVFRRLRGEENVRPGQRLAVLLPGEPNGAGSLFELAGLTCVDGRLTSAGARVLTRGSGPCGIVYSYRPHFAALAERLTKRGGGLQIARSENLTASQTGNRNAFRGGNAALDRFCERTGYRYDLFIEHAMGRAEAIRQRFLLSGEAGIRYVGADTDDAAIRAAEGLRAAGELPLNMRLVRSCDIGRPATLLDALRVAGIRTSAGVMMVGNGFHEIRAQTDEGIAAVLGEYCRAGLVLILTEESLLDDDSLRATAWNSYHGGFRYLHTVSGQWLRPYGHRDEALGRDCWGACLSRAGYLISEEFSVKSRPIFPCDDSPVSNPPISVTYFCVPEELARSLSFA